MSSEISISSVCHQTARSPARRVSLSRGLDPPMLRDTFQLPTSMLQEGEARPAEGRGMVLVFLLTTCSFQGPAQAQTGLIGQHGQGWSGC